MKSLAERVQALFDAKRQERARGRAWGAARTRAFQGMRAGGRMKFGTGKKPEGRPK